MNDLNLLEALFSGLKHAPFYVKDRDLRYRAANEAMAALCGVKAPRDMLGRTARDFYPAVDAHRFEAIEKRVIASGHPSMTMLDFIPGRQPAWLVFSNHPMFDADGRAVGVAGAPIRLEKSSFENDLYRRLRLVSEQLQTDLAHPKRLSTLASLAGVSIAQLQRDFKKVFRMPIRRFLMLLRLGRARELLSTGRSIAEIAHEVGFVDHSAFSRRFSIEFGETPSAFRKCIALSQEAVEIGPR